MGKKSRDTTIDLWIALDKQVVDEILETTSKFDAHSFNHEAFRTFISAFDSTNKKRNRGKYYCYDIERDYTKNENGKDVECFYQEEAFSHDFYKSKYDIDYSDEELTEEEKKHEGDILGNPYCHQSFILKLMTYGKHKDKYQHQKLEIYANNHCDRGCCPTWLIFEKYNKHYYDTRPFEEQLKDMKVGDTYRS